MAGGAARTAEEILSPPTSTSSPSFLIVILVLIACAAVAAFIVYVQRKRHDGSSLLTGLDDRYDDVLDRLVAMADEYDAAMAKDPEPSKLEKRNAIIKRASAVIPLVRLVQTELAQKQVLYREGKMRPEDFEGLSRLKQGIEDETEIIKQLAEDINPGFGNRIFQMVASSQHFQILFMMDKNAKAYAAALEERPSVRERKLLLIIHRAYPCFEFLKQISAVPIEELHKQGKISVDEYECFLGVKHRLEAEKKAVEEEGLKIDDSFKVFHHVMGPQQQLYKLCLEADRIVRSYEAFVEKSDLSSRQRILALLLRKTVPLINFHTNLSQNGEEAEKAFKDGKIPHEVYESILSVKDRVEKKLQAAKEEADELIPTLGGKLERIWESQKEHFRPILQMEANIDAYTEKVKKEGESMKPNERLELLVEKRVKPAMELDEKLKSELEVMDGKHQEGQIDDEEMEIFMAVKERVEDELRDVKEEANEIRGEDGDIVDEIIQAAEKKKRDAAALRAKERKSETTKERLKAKVGEKKSSSMGSRGSSLDEEDLAAKIAEAEKIAAELLAEESKGKGKKQAPGRQKSK